MLIPPAARHANPLSIGWRAAPPLSRWDNRDYSRPPPRSGGGPRPVRIRRTRSGAHSCSYEEDKFLNTPGLEAQVTAVQFSDGRIDDSNVYEPPQVICRRPRLPCPCKRVSLLRRSSMRANTIEGWLSAMTDPETAALDVACPICGVAPGELCQDVVRGHIGPVERPHLYRTSVAAGCRNDNHHY